MARSRSFASYIGWLAAKLQLQFAIPLFLFYRRHHFGAPLVPIDIDEDHATPYVPPARSRQDNRL
jgi:hypothetical protein